MLDALDGTSDQLDSVAPCVSDYCAQRFLTPDESVFTSKEIPVTLLFPKLSRHRGEIILSKPMMTEGTCQWLESPFPMRARTLLFDSAYCTPSTKGATEQVGVEQPVVRVKKTARHVVTNGCMQRSGMKLSKQVSNSVAWNLHWGGRLEDDEFSALQSFQKVNHFPGTWVLGRKDALAKHIRLCGQKKGRAEHFHFAPRTYTWPTDRAIILRDAADGSCFIVKPPAGARGEGISLFCGSIPTFLQEMHVRNVQKKNAPSTPPPHPPQLLQRASRTTPTRTRTPQMKTKTLLSCSVTSPIRCASTGTR